MPRRRRLAYAGDDSFVTCLQAMLDRPDIELVLCLTAEDGRFTGTVDELARVQQAKLIHGPPGPSGWAQINDVGADLLVSAAYGYRIPVEQLNVATMMNVHPSYLPEGRGPNPLVHLAGSAATAADITAAGVTVHLLDRDFDTGPILVRERFEDLGQRPSLMDLTLRALAAAPVLLNRVLDDLDGHVEAALDQTAGSYWPSPDPSESIVDLRTADGATIVAANHRFSRQGFSLRLSDRSLLPVASVHFTEAEHPFQPGRVVGRLRGDYLVGTRSGLIRATPFSDGP